MANNLKTEDTIFGFTKKSVHAALSQNWHILHYQLWALEFPFLTCLGQIVTSIPISNQAEAVLSCL